MASWAEQFSHSPWIIKITIENGDLPIEIVDLPDLPMENGDLTMEIVDLPDLPMENGDLPTEIVDLPIENVVILRS